MEPGKRGIYNLRGPGELPLSRAFEMLGRKPFFWPAGLAQRALNGLWASRLTSFPAAELDHIRYVCMVDDSRARRELGYRPRYDMQQTVQAVNQEW